MLLEPRCYFFFCFGFVLFNQACQSTSQQTNASYQVYICLFYHPYIHMHSSPYRNIVQWCPTRDCRKNWVWTSCAENIPDEEGIVVLTYEERRIIFFFFFFLDSTTLGRLWPPLLVFFVLFFSFPVSPITFQSIQPLSFRFPFFVLDFLLQRYRIRTTEFEVAMTWSFCRDYENERASDSGCSFFMEQNLLPFRE